ncbi:unnamed protein product, partial [Rotaria sp. Silwood2]
MIQTVGSDEYDQNDELQFNNNKFIYPLSFVLGCYRYHPNEFCVSFIKKSEAAEIMKEKLEQYLPKFKLEQVEDDNSLKSSITIRNHSSRIQHQIKVVDRKLLNISV